MTSIDKGNYFNCSNEYYQLVEKLASNSSEKNKFVGKFYTDYDVAKDLAMRLVESFQLQANQKIIRIIDPFCGDGRLIIEVLKLLAKNDLTKKTSISIDVWDIDCDATTKAISDINEIISSENIEAQVRCKVTDAFVECFENEEKYDICVSNPPWGLLKPLKFVNNKKDTCEYEAYLESLSNYDRYIKDAFKISKASSGFGKWTTNVGRCGLEVALKLLNNNGVCGIVLPASIFIDQVSVDFRKWIIENYQIDSVSYYPAELKLYGAADVSSVTAVLHGGETNKFLLRNYVKRNYYKEALTKVYHKDEFVIPITDGIIHINGDEYISLEELLSSNELKFVRELDETRVYEKLDSSGEIIFAKGYMVDRYCFKPDGLFLKADITDIPSTVNSYKLVWRDVSRNSQFRRIRATVLPPGCIVGNSLGCIVGNDSNLLFCLVGVINSFVFEALARNRLLTNHVSKGVLKKLMLPSEVLRNDLLLKLVTEKINGLDNEIYLEILVAHLYKLTLVEFINVLHYFKVNEDYVIRVRKHWKIEDWENDI